MVLIKELRKKWALFVMALPGLLLLIAFNYLPMFGTILAFKSFNYSKGIIKSPWSGFKNFEYLFKTNAAFEITRNTILYNVTFILLGIVLSVAFAIMLSEITNRVSAKIYQTVFIMPHFLSWVVVSFVFFSLLSVDKGMINSILVKAGTEPISWYSEPKYWPFIIVLVHLWKAVGYSSVVYLAAIAGIPQEFYEAALIDGATKMQQIKNITIPFLKPIIIILFILSVGKIFYADFGLFYQVPRNSGQLYSVTNVIDTYVFNGLQNVGDVGMSAAAAFYQSIVGFILVLASNLIVRKIDKEYALF